MCLCDEAFCFLITLQSLLPWLCGPDCSVGVENEYYLNKFYLYSPQYRSDLSQFYIFPTIGVDLTPHALASNIWPSNPRYLCLLRTGN